MIKDAYRDLPTALYPKLPPDADPADPPVTLTTTKYSDLAAQLRANFTEKTIDGKYHVNRETHADLDPELATLPFCRPEPQSTWRRLLSLRPPKMFVLGEKTYQNIKEIREGIKTTGTGVGGSGGIAENKVREVMLPGQPHVFPFIVIKETAKLCFEWLNTELDHYQQHEERWDAERSRMNPRDHLTLGSKWSELLKPIAAFKTKL